MLSEKIILTYDFLNLSLAEMQALFLIDQTAERWYNISMKRRKILDDKQNFTFGNRKQ